MCGAAATTTTTTVRGPSPGGLGPRVHRVREDADWWASVTIDGRHAPLVLVNAALAAAGAESAVLRWAAWKAATGGPGHYELALEPRS